MYAIRSYYGYCLAPEPLSIELQKIHQYLTFASNTPIQLAYAEFMQNKDLYLNLPDFYQQKRDLFLNLISKSRFNPLPCKGTYYQMLDYSQISDEPDVIFAKRLTTEHGVAVIPPSALYGITSYSIHYTKLYEITTVINIR